MPEQPGQKLQLKWRSRAQKQWEKILVFFAKRNQSLDYSLKLDAELNQKLDLLCEHPELGEETQRKKTRRHTFENYAVFYRVKGTGLAAMASKSRLSSTPGRIGNSIETLNKFV